MSVRRIQTCAALILLVSAFALHAQVATGRLVGAVIESRSQQPIANADLIHLKDGRSVTTDSLGRFTFDKLPAGLVRFMVRAPRFPVVTFVVALTPGEFLEREIILDSMPDRPEPSQALPEVKVEAAPSLGPRFADFERRLRTGRGQYLTRGAIEKANFASVVDAMRGLRGVNVVCGGGMGCSILMARAPARCPPDYIVDERVDNFFGPNTAIRDIEGIEVYTGPADLPGEFSGRNSGCGLIVIWTRAGPPRARKPAPDAS